MKANTLLQWARDADKRLQRRLNPDQRRVLVNSRTPVNYAIVEPVYKVMRKDPRVKFYFTASEEPQRIREIYREAGEEIQLIHPRQAAMMKFDVYLASDFMWATLPRGALRVQTFHGVAGKYNFDKPDHTIRVWDRFFFINRRRMSNYIKYGVVKPDSPAARLVGMPKVDCLANGSLDRARVLGELGLDPGKPTVIYAPTWSPYSSLNSMGEELVRLLIAAGYAVIVKLHDRSGDRRHRYSGGVDWPGLLKPILRKGEGALASGSNSCPYLAAADVMITDHSSIGFEYLLLDRPLIRIEVPELIANASIHEDYVKLLAEASTTVHTAEEAARAVETCLADPARQSTARRAVCEEIYYQPGTATARAVRELYDALELQWPVASGHWSVVPG
ncbi:MAG TPA: CDP-glycerol glycerophosphotransferase family protein [Blastocatellia bacterium]|nr:CDP-glycerol glycerophosphotransferase family protein [Blastocatellia bacterium]